MYSHPSRLAWRRGRLTCRRGCGRTHQAATSCRPCESNSVRRDSLVSRAGRVDVVWASAGVLAHRASRLRVLRFRRRRGSPKPLHFTPGVPPGRDSPSNGSRAGEEAGPREAAAPAQRPSDAESSIDDQSGSEPQIAVELIRTIARRLAPGTSDREPRRHARPRCRATQQPSLLARLGEMDRGMPRAGRGRPRPPGFLAGRMSMTPR
jgi:hypothetical protein